jgi:hypothetical protein
VTALADVQRLHLAGPARFPNAASVRPPASKLPRKP